MLRLDAVTAMPSSVRASAPFGIQRRRGLRHGRFSTYPMRKDGFCNGRWPCPQPNACKASNACSPTSGSGSRSISASSCGTARRCRPICPRRARHRHRRRRRGRGADPPAKDRDARSISGSPPASRFATARSSTSWRGGRRCARKHFRKALDKMTRAARPERDFCSYRAAAHGRSTACVATARGADGSEGANKAEHRISLRPVERVLRALSRSRRWSIRCALFHRCRMTTSPRAQRDKLDMICRKLRLKPGERFLDIGCGWGALLCHAAEHYGVRAHGVTLVGRAVRVCAGEGRSGSACRIA